MDLTHNFRQADRIPVTSRIVRQRRILDGKEVELSLQSVAALQGIGASKERLPNKRFTTYYFDSEAASAHKLEWPELTIQEKYYGGLSSVESRPQGYGSFDSFSVLPETSPGLYSKHTLIQYCKKNSRPVRKITKQIASHDKASPVARELRRTD